MRNHDCSCTGQNVGSLHEGCPEPIQAHWQEGLKHVAKQLFCQGGGSGALLSQGRFFLFDQPRPHVRHQETSSSPHAQPSLLLMHSKQESLNPGTGLSAYPQQPRLYRVAASESCLPACRASRKDLQRAYAAELEQQASVATPWSAVPTNQYLLWFFQLPSCKLKCFVNQA